MVTMSKWLISWMRSIRKALAMRLERRRKKKQRDQEALIISQDMIKIPEVMDILILEQDKQDLS